LPAKCGSTSAFKTSGRLAWILRGGVAGNILQTISTVTDAMAETDGGCSAGTVEPRDCEYGVFGMGLYFRFQEYQQEGLESEIGRS
jgi:hypothetical protein